MTLSFQYEPEEEQDEISFEEIILYWIEQLQEMESIDELQELEEIS
jgi:hypothetical protein